VRSVGQCIAEVRVRVILIGIAGAAAAGCAGDDGAATGYTVRDSAGIEIVENTSGMWSDGDHWIVSTEPTVDIGVLDGAPEYQLFRVRGALRLADGRIVVSNTGTSELRFYGSDGRYLRSTGRAGSGPGEFQRLGWIRPFAGDSILAYDFSLTRASVFDAAGAFGRSFRLAPPGETGFVIGMDVLSPDAVLGKMPLALSGGLSFEEGAQRRDEIYWRFSAEGTPVDSLGQFAGPEQWIETARSGDQFSVFLTSPPFGRSPVLAARGEQFCFGSGDTYELGCYATDGTLLRLIRRNHANLPVTDADVERLLQRELADADAEDRPRIERRYEEVPVPETMPAYSDLRVDPDGNLWVLEYNPDSEADLRWTVFDSSGRMLGLVMTPAGLGVTEFGRDYVLGVWRDDLDVEHVQMYTLRKGREEA
jgi:hypothetical protein